jgi:hypothetical protein
MRPIDYIYKLNGDVDSGTAKALSWSVFTSIRVKIREMPHLHWSIYDPAQRRRKVAMSNWEISVFGVSLFALLCVLLFFVYIAVAAQYATMIHKHAIKAEIEQVYLCERLGGRIILDKNKKISGCTK